MQQRSNPDQYEGGGTRYETTYRVKTLTVNNTKTILFGSLCLAVSGMVFLLTGAILTGVVYTEVRPPTADENYDRYLGADMRRILGPTLIILGIVMMVVSCCVLGFTFISSNPEEAVEERVKEIFVDPPKKKHPTKEETRVEDEPSQHQ